MAITVFDQTPVPSQLNAAIVPGPLSTAMTAAKSYDGTEAVGTSMQKVFTCGTEGSQLPKLKLRFGSTAGAQATGTTNASVARVWANNGSVNTTATNNTLLGEVAIPSVTMTQVGVPASTIADFDFGLMSLPAGWNIYVGIATAIGGTACAVIPSMLGGGDYK